MRRSRKKSSAVSCQLIFEFFFIQSSSEEKLLNILNVKRNHKSYHEPALEKLRVNVSQYTLSGSSFIKVRSFLLFFQKAKVNTKNI